MTDGASSRWPLGLGAVAGGLAGVAVGALDGWQAAHAVGAPGSATLATIALALFLEGLLGWAAGVAVEAAGRLAVWGRAARAPNWARLIAFLAGGAAAGLAAVAVVVATSLRKNRFLAAGLTAAGALGSGLLAFALIPALSRLLSSRRAARQPARAPSAALLVVGPALGALASIVIFVAVARTRAPLHGPALIERSAWSALAAFLLPLGLSRGAELRAPLWRRRALWLVAAGTLVAAAGAGTAAFWETDLRFAPWRDIAAAAAILILGVAIARGWRWPGRAAVGGALILGIALTAGLLRASQSEPGRKIASARAALVGPTLQAGQSLLDLDGDGY